MLPRRRVRLEPAEAMLRRSALRASVALAACGVEPAVRAVELALRGVDFVVRGVAGAEMSVVKMVVPLWSFPACASLPTCPRPGAALSRRRFMLASLALPVPEDRQVMALRVGTVTTS
ncbi:hypothetical protein BF93_15305 [Brachybacterium phenoliresistens]|uniref:Uncharacterized protein n=2 Tax=Brachybacterium phenoliresistens TaxID=396014 RepID=Z9JUM5_9MICO|nr:hypothetical protein BF93_15305 [Brachybacterium phenoliresistens]